MSATLVVGATSTKSSTVAFAYAKKRQWKKEMENGNTVTTRSERIRFRSRIEQQKAKSVKT